MVFNYFFQKSPFTENYSLIAAISMATRGPLYTCLVNSQFVHWSNKANITFIFIFILLKEKYVSWSSKANNTYIYIYFYIA